MKIRFDRMFLVLGTVLLLVLTSFVSYNFLNDSRLIAEGIPVSSPKDKEGNKETPSKTPESNSSDTYETLKYRRKADVVEPKKTPSPSPTVSATPSVTPSATPSSKNEKVSIQLVNYTGMNKLAEHVKIMLEEKGYVISVSSATSVNFMPTKIIDKSDKNLAGEIRKVLKAGRLEKETGTESRFDVTVILGDDYALP